MGIETALILKVATATAAVAATASYIEGKEARKEQASAQRQAQSEQKAANASSAAVERRQQIREARVRQARILQSSRNTGGAGSSSEMGAISGINTQLSANIGTNVGQIASANRMSDLSTESNLAGIKAQEANSMFNLSSSIFSSLGGPEKTIKLLD